MSDSKFKIGDLVRGEDDYCISTGLISSLPAFSHIYIIEVIATERTTIGRGYSAINPNGDKFLESELTLIGLPYSKMLQRHGHKKSWNTVLPKTPEPLPEVGALVKILDTKNFSRQSEAREYGFAKGKIVEISHEDPHSIEGRFWHLISPVDSSTHCFYKKRFKVL